MKIAEFFASLGFKTDSKGIEQFENSLQGVKSKMIGVKELIVGGMIYGINRFVEASTNAANSMYDFNQQTGLSLQKLQMWQNTGTLSNLALSADEVTSSVYGLQSALTQLKLGTGNIQPFAMLGIDPTGKDAFQVLEELKQIVPLLDRDIATNIIGKLD